MKRSKKYNEAAKKIDQSLTYSPSQAVKLAKETSTTKYDATVEVSMVLGVDPKKADQAVRSTVNLPHGTGKTARVLVFAGGERAEEARAAGADIVTVLGVSGLATCQGVIKAANAHGAEAQIDLINVEDKVACARATAEAGAQIMGIHTGLDAQAAGHTPFADLNAIAALGLPVRISVAGGIKPSTVQDVVRAGANIIVVGAAIYGAASPADAAREIRELVDAV